MEKWYYQKQKYKKYHKLSNNKHFNIDKYLNNNNLTFTLVTIPQLICITSLSIYTYYTLKRLLCNNNNNNPCENVCALYHNIHGKFNEKMIDLNYLNILQQNERIDLFVIAEHMKHNINEMCKPIGYKTIYNKTYITENNGHVNGNALLINNINSDNYSITENNEFYFRIESIAPQFTLCAGYGPCKDEDIYNIVLTNFLNIIYNNNVINKPTVCVADFNARLGKYLGDTDHNSRGIELLKQLKDLDIEILNKYNNNYGKFTFQQTFNANRTSIIDLVICPRWVLQNYNIKIDIISNNFGSDHKPIKIKIEKRYKRYINLQNHIYQQNNKSYCILIPRLKLIKITSNDENNSKFFKLFNKHIIYEYEKMRRSNTFNSEKLNTLIKKHYIDLGFEYNIIKIIKFKHKQVKLYNIFKDKTKYVIEILEKIKQNENKYLQLLKTTKNNKQLIQKCKKTNIQLNIQLNLLINKLNAINRINLSNKLMKTIKKDSKTFFKIINNNNKYFDTQYLLSNALINNNTNTICKKMVESFEYFKELMKPKGKNITSLSNEFELSYKYDETPQGKIDAQRPSILHLLKVFKKLNPKASEAFNIIQYDFINYLINNNTKLLLILWKIFWKNEMVSYEDALIKLNAIPKKDGSPRGIGPSSILLKFFSIATFELIREKIEKHIDNNQFAYKKNIGTNDALLSHYILISQIKVITKQICVTVGIDYKKAYPSTDIDQVFHIYYHKCDVKGKIWRIMYNIATLPKTIVSFANINSPPITRYRGERQGDAPSGTNYNLIAQIMHKQCINENTGIKLNLNNILTINKYGTQTGNIYGIKLVYFDNLSDKMIEFINNNKKLIIPYIAYADDINNYTTTLANSQSNINKLNDINPIFKMEINNKKTKYIIYNESKKQEIDKIIEKVGLKSNNQILTKVYDIIYLGIKYQHTLKFKKNVKTICDKIKVLSYKVKLDLLNIFKYNPIIMNYLFKININSVMEYGMAVIPYTKKQEEKIFNKQTECLCNILNINIKTSKYILSLAFNIEHTSYRATYLQLTNFYSILNKNNNILSKKLLIYDMIIMYNIKYNNNILQSLHPQYKYLFSYHIFQKLQDLELEKYFHPELPDKITITEWKTLIKNKLKQYWNKIYFRKISTNIPSVFQMIIKNNVINSKNSECLFKKSLLQIINEWCLQHINMNITQINIHKQFFNIAFGAHPYFFTIYDKNKKNKIKQYRKCVLCKQGWWKQDPLIHLVTKCTVLTKIIGGLPKYPNANKFKNNDNNNIMNNIIDEEINKQYVKLKKEYNDNNTNIKINNTNNNINNQNIANLNWVQYNYMLWFLDKNKKININNAFYDKT